MFSAKHRTVILSKTGNCFCRPSTSCRTRLPCWWQFWCRGTATVRCVNRRWWRVPASARQQPPQHGLRRSSVRRTRRRHHAELPSWQSFLSSTTFHGSSSTTDPKTRLRFHVLNDQVQVLGMQVQVWVPSTNMRKTAAAGNTYLCESGSSSDRLKHMFFEWYSTSAEFWSQRGLKLLTITQSVWNARRWSSWQVRSGSSSVCL